MISEKVYSICNCTDTMWYRYVDVIKN